MPHPDVRKHRCPAHPCQEYVSDRLLACPTHWFQLPTEVRVQIEATAGMPILNPTRRAALSAAQAVWKENRT
jgi:hypothetical protein